jgi:hypothetical protein
MHIEYLCTLYTDSHNPPTINPQIVHGGGSGAADERDNLSRMLSETIAKTMTRNAGMCLVDVAVCSQGSGCFPNGT